MWHVLLCQVVRLSGFCYLFANKATTAKQLGTIARPFNTKDRLRVVLCGSFVLDEFHDVACAIVPSFVAAGFIFISLPIKLPQPRNLAQ